MANERERRQPQTVKDGNNKKTGNTQRTRRPQEELKNNKSKNKIKNDGKNKIKNDTKNARADERTNARVNSRANERTNARVNSRVNERTNAGKGGAKKKSNNGSEVMALSVVSFVLNTALTVIFYVVVVIAIVRASKTVYNFGYEIFGNVSVDVYPGRTVNVVIEEGETTMNVASKLELNKIIKNKYSFYLRTKLSEKDIYPGTYQVNTSMNYEQILDVIADYDTALENLENQAEQSNGTVNSN